MGSKSGSSARMIAAAVSAQFFILQRLRRGHQYIKLVYAHSLSNVRQPPCGHAQLNGWRHAGGAAQLFQLSVQVNENGFLKPFPDMRSLKMAVATALA